MKKRRNLIISLLLVAALALGIGYAALLNDQLDIGGTAEVDGGDMSKEFDSLVYFSSATVGDKTGNVTGSAGVYADNNDSAHFSLSGFAAENDYGVVNFTVQNDHSNPVKITVKTHAAHDPADPLQLELDMGGDEIIIPAGEDASFSITATLKNLVAETFTANHSVSFTVEEIVE